MPQYFQSKMTAICDHFLKESSQPPVLARRIVLNIHEASIVPLLDRLVAGPHCSPPNNSNSSNNSNGSNSSNTNAQAAPWTGCKIGSYPYVEHPDFKTIIVIEGSDVQAVEGVQAELLAGLPASVVVRVEEVRHKRERREDSSSGSGGV